MSKIVNMIKNLPNNPERKIIWVCYNEDMKSGISDLFKSIKGQNYANNVVFLSYNELELNLDGDVYFSPDLFDHVGNGAN